MKSLIYVLFFLSTIFSGYSQDSLNMRLLFNWNDTTLPSSAGHNNRYNDVWGYAKNGKEYAIIGSTMGTHIIDVTTPSLTYQVAFIPGKSQGTNIIHRDFKVYKDYLYGVCDQGLTSLQIIDLRFLPDSAPLVYNSDTMIKRAHNVFIDTLNAKLYLAGGNSTGQIYDISNPIYPVQLADNTYPYMEHDMFVYRDTVYSSDGNNGLHIYDYRDVPNFSLIGQITFYPYKGYNHSSWLDTNRRLLVVADENHGSPLKIFDISDLSNIEFISTFTTGLHSQSIPHNPFFKDEYIYVSYYHDGIWVFDASDPYNAVPFAYYKTSTEAYNFNYKGCWGVYPFLPSGNILASDMQNGLFVLEFIQKPNSIKTHQNIKHNFSVYPNPVSGDFVSIKNLKDLDFNAELYSSDFKLIEKFQSTENNYRLNMSNKNSGLYFLKIYSDQITETIKIVKTH